MLLIITSTSDELLRAVNTDDLEWLWTPKIRGFNDFVFDFGLIYTFQQWIAPKWLEIDQDNLQTKFLSLNIDFSSPSFDPLRLTRPAHAGVKQGYLPKSVFLLLACLAWKRLQIGTDMLLVISSTGDMLLVLSTPMTVNDPELSKLGF